nr:MAG TPA: hypothetical protein [Caudoviricetes sp.]
MIYYRYEQHTKTNTRIQPTHRRSRLSYERNLIRDSNQNKFI